jgi:hypothetical protein
MAREKGTREQKDLPEFRHGRTQREILEAEFLRAAGEFVRSMAKNGRSRT